MKCELCEQEHDGNYGSGRFCCSKCARSFSTKNKRCEINEKLRTCNKGRLSDEEYVKRYGKEKDVKKCPIYGILITNREEYVKLKWSIYNPARLKTINRLAKMFDIELGTSETPKLLDKAVEQLRHEYKENGMSGSDIKNKYGLKCHNSNVLNFLKTLGIERRDLTNANLNAIERGNINPSDNGHKYNYLHGWYEDWRGHKHYYRSSYELIFYNEMDEKREVYETESLRIRYFDSQQNKERIAIPDVLIGDTIYEIKSDYTLDKQNMLDRVKSYKEHGYKFFLVLEGKIYTEKYLMG